MPQGSVLSIFLHQSGKGGPLTPVEEAEAVAGAGLVGDGYFRAGDPDQEVTFIESEAIEAIDQEEGLRLAPADARRNVLTRGVALNHLVNREFTVGGVRLKGVRLCEPCSHLQKLTQPGILKALLHRGGLRARVVTGGVLRVGDAIEYGSE